jgi:hypothetical protein
LVPLRFVLALGAVIVGGCDCSSGALPLPSGSSDAAIAEDAAASTDAESADGCFTSCTSTWAVLPANRPQYLAEPGDAPAPAIYDPDRQRLIMIGAPSNVTWIFPLAPSEQHEFSVANTSGALPSPFVLGATYDSKRKKMLVTSVGSNQTIQFDALDLATLAWQPVTALQTPTLFQQKLFYDPVRDQYVAITQQTQDLWVTDALPPLAWQRVGTGQGSASAYAIDTLRGRILSIDPGGNAKLLDFDPTPTWRDLPRLPPDIGLYAAVYDPPNDRFIAVASTPRMWSLSASTAASWSFVETSTVPSARRVQTAVYDSKSERMVLVGGLVGFGGPYLNDVWGLSFGPNETPSWSTILPNEPRPFSDFEVIGAATYDSNRNAVLFVSAPKQSPGVQMETWRIWLPPNQVAERLQVIGRPSPRMLHTIIHQPYRDRLILYGGTTIDGAPLSDVWTLDFATSTWAPLPTTGQAPSPRAMQQGSVQLPENALFLSEPDRLVIFGPGRMDGSSAAMFELSLDGAATWTEIATSNPPPFASVPGSAVLLRDRREIVKGEWALHLDSVPPSWTPTGLPPTHGAFTDYALSLDALVSVGVGLQVRPLFCPQELAAESDGVRPLDPLRIVSTPSGVVTFAGALWWATLQCQ